MNHTMFIRVCAAVLAVVSAAAASERLRAAEHAGIVPFLADDVVAIGRVNLDQIDVTAIVDELVRLNLIPEVAIDEARKKAAELQQDYAELPQRGARKLYVLLRMSDFAADGTTWVIETDSEQSARSAERWLKSRLGEIALPGDLQDAVPNVIETEGRFVVGGPSAQRVQEILEKRTESPRAEALAALESLEDADAGFVIFGNTDSRRVVREMFPQLPAPFMEIDGKLLADGIASGSVRVAFPPNPTVTLAIETSGDEAGDVLEQAFGKAREVLRTFLAAEMVSGPSAHQQRAAALLPMLGQLELKREDGRLSLTFGDDEAELAFLRNILPALTQDMRDESYRGQRMNDFKHLALAMLNYESAKETYPPAASYDDENRPLLSWRVHVLPYLGESELYKQFRLDEPWDSEHNRKLIEKMPEAFADPDPSVRAAIEGEGRTTYVVPTGEGLMFGGKEGFELRDVKDGTSNTILLVEVAPDEAVVWTKPEDWDVDLEEPLKGLRRENRDWFTTAYADGSARVLSTKNEPSVIRRLLTPNGGETIDYSQLK